MVIFNLLVGDCLLKCGKDCFGVLGLMCCVLGGDVLSYVEGGVEVL